MTWAFGEVEHLVRKAVSGAGKPWGMAEEAGWAVRWLAERGLPGPEAIAECLDISSYTCPVSAGMALADAGVLVPPAEYAPMTSPILLLPFLSRLCPKGAALAVQIADAEVTASRDCVVFSGSVPKMAAVTVRSVGAVAPQVQRLHRIEQIAPAALARLETFAAKTYAPATEQSRQTGAGAGLTDND